MFDFFVVARRRCDAITPHRRHSKHVQYALSMNTKVQRILNSLFPHSFVYPFFLLDRVEQNTQKIGSWRHVIKHKITISWRRKCGAKNVGFEGLVFWVISHNRTFLNISNMCYANCNLIRLSILPSALYERETLLM